MERQHLSSVFASLQMTTNNAVNRNLAWVINNWNNSYYLWTNKVIYHLCMINELLLWFKIKIIGNCFNFTGDISLGSIYFNCFWNLFHDSAALTVVEYFPYLFVV